MNPHFDESSPYLSGFNDYYLSHIAPGLVEFEAGRRAAMRQAAPMALGGLISAVAIIPAYILFGDYAILPIIAAVGLLIWAWHVVADSKQDLKVFLAKKVFSFFGLTFTDYAGGFYRDQFDALGMLPAYNTANLEDRIAGTHDGVKIDIAEAHLLKLKSSGKHASYRTTFRGLLCAFSFPKDFNGRTVIRTEKRWHRKLVRRIKSSDERVILEDSLFNNLFEVDSTDQTEARYLLTPAFMERLLILIDRLDSRRTNLAFDMNRLLISLDLRADSFEAGSPFESAYDKERVQSLIDEVMLIFEVIDGLALKLKTRV